MSKIAFAQYKSICQLFSELLSYPTLEHQQAIAQLAELPLPRLSRTALHLYREATARLPLSARQEFYTRTFDLSPLCSPALSVHLFGVESFKRSHLMVGLLDMYRDAGFDVKGEAADHMPTVTRFLPHAVSSERQEIVQHILIPALSKMAELLKSKQNAYGHLLDAVIAAVGVLETTEVAYA